MAIFVSQIMRLPPLVNGNQFVYNIARVPRMPFVDESVWQG